MACEIPKNKKISTFNTSNPKNQNHQILLFPQLDTSFKIQLSIF